MYANKEVKNDIVEWDVRNWWKAIEKWNVNSVEGLDILDLGARNGGMSLYFALMGGNVICSDLDIERLEEAVRLHKKYNVEHKIKYGVINAVEMDFDNEFDIITFKSVLGGVGCDNNYIAQKTMIRNIYNALRPGGRLYFVENLEGSRLHMFGRKIGRSWGRHWRYISLKEIKDLCSDFSKVKICATVGFLGVFCKNKNLNTCLSCFDDILDKFIPDKSKYIVSVVCEK